MIQNAQMARAWDVCFVTLKRLKCGVCATKCANAQRFPAHVCTGIGLGFASIGSYAGAKA
jgi:hypothetical protein